ncbi:hypothetical protein RN001_009379 [Aquatica leii]|uniref:DDE Tnp4 domain-containing protein n=1 Tax=Aquatica leii TaxID=1421715 RepID=A0AAN7QG84_9COLE|nr:hypothetical protein RN001_009379 [Aquatica leii]
MLYIALTILKLLLSLLKNILFENIKLIHFLGEVEDKIGQVLDEFFMNYLVTMFFRYGVPFERGSIPKSRDVMINVLPNFDENRFRQMVRVNWRTFNIILNLIKDDDVFNGQNSWKQLPIKYQLTITLFCLGCYGKGSSIRKVATLFGVGDGDTVSNITKMVFTEIVSKTYSELPHCVGYVDGTEIRLAEKPKIDSEAYFSRKHQYSLKMQAVLIGYPGSIHDSRIYTDCPLFTNANQYFSGHEWIVGDSAYKLTTTVITPYCSTAKQGTPNERKCFNENLIKYRVRIENCFAYLKERFSSSKELKIDVGSDANNSFACQWISVCCIISFVQ